MVSKSIAVLFALGVLLCAYSMDATAQGSQSCGIGWYCSLYGGVPCSPTPPPTALKPCYNLSPGIFVCQVPTSACYRGNPEEPCPRCTTAGKPISLATGNTYIEQTDVSVPGLGGGLSLVRTWNSKLPPIQGASVVGMFGPMWRSTYEERIFVGSDGYFKYSRGDGSTWSFGFASSPADGNFKYQAVAPANGGGAASLMITPSSWPITFGNGEQRFFDTTTGNLVSIVDRNGNKTQISYDSSGRLATVTDPVGRHLYFNYPSSGSLVTSVTSDVALTLSYSYDSQGRLTRVTKPDQSTVSFTYDNQSMITSVTDSQGKILESHTYDSSGRGLSSSRAGGVDALTISYPK